MEFITKRIRKYEDNVGVLFIITIDSTKVSSSTSSFALIKDYSDNYGENEILFSMPSIFRVEDVKQSGQNDRVWEIQLTLIGDNDPPLVDVIQNLQQEFHGVGWHRMSKLMIHLGHFDEGQLFHNQLLKNASDDNDKALAYLQLGYLKDKQGEHKEALQLYNNAMEIRRKDLPDDHPSLAPYYNDLGLAYNNMGDYSKAIEFYEKASKIRQTDLPADDPALTPLYNNIGLAYCNKGEYTKALEYYLKSMEIREKTLPSNHPNLATSYNNIGGIYKRMRDHEKALEYYQKSLQIREKALARNHLDLAATYNNIGQVYDEINDNAKALFFLEKAYSIWEKSLPPTHRYIKSVKMDIKRLRKK